MNGPDISTNACHELFCAFGDFYSSGKRDAQVPESLYDHLIAVYSADICMFKVLVDLLVHISREVKYDFLPSVRFEYFGSCGFNEITCSSRSLRGYLIDRQLTLINTKASSISWKSTALSCKECKDEQVTMTTWFNKTRSQVFERYKTQLSIG